MKFEIIKVPSSNVSFTRVMVGLRFCATLNIVLINTLDNFLYLGQRSRICLQHPEFNFDEHGKVLQIDFSLAQRDAANLVPNASEV